MENQEVKISVKTTAEKTSFLARLRTNIMPLVLAGGVFFGSEAAAANPKPELKKITQEAAILKLMQDPKVKSGEIRLAADTFLDLQGEKGEATLFSLLGKPNVDETLQESIVYALRRELVSRVKQGEESAKAVKKYLDVLQDKTAVSDVLIHAMRIVGWECVSDTKIAVGWGQDAEGKPFLIKGKNTPETLRHVVPDIFPLIIDQLGHADDTVRKFAGHELTGIILFADGDGKTLEAIRRLASDNSDPLRQKEAQNIVDFIDQIDRSATAQTVEDKPKEEPKAEENLQITSEYDKWIKILQDPESKLHQEAFDALLKLGGNLSINVLAEFAAQEPWARNALSQAISAQNLGEEYKQKAEVAKEALIDGIGVLLKTNSDEALRFLNSHHFYHNGGFGKYTGELINTYLTVKSPFNKDSIAQIFKEMPKEEKKAAIRQAFDHLSIKDPAGQADMLDLLRNITRDEDEDKALFEMRAQNAALNILSDINNRSALDSGSKSKLLYYLPVNVPNSEAIANYLKSDNDSNVRNAAYSVLIRSGKDEMIGEMIKDQDPRVKSAGYFQVTNKAYKLKEQNQPYANEAKPLYDALRNETDEEVRADVVSHLTALNLPADEALTDNSPEVRVRGVYNLQERVRKGDQTAFSRLKQIAANEQENGYVRVKAKEFVNDWEEWQKRKQEEGQ